MKNSFMMKILYKVDWNESQMKTWFCEHDIERMLRFIVNNLFGCGFDCSTKVVHLLNGFSFLCHGCGFELIK